MDQKEISEGKQKKDITLNIVNSKNKHRGFGAGSIDLNNISPVIIDRGQAYIDIAAMHAKSKVERGIRFSANPEDIVNGRLVYIVWVAVDRLAQDGPCYAGAASCEMRIDEEAKRGWKVLAQHVNRMDDALKRKFVLHELGVEDKIALKKLLVTHQEDWWNASPTELKSILDL